jgi:hypothetical protein
MTQVISECERCHAITRDLRYVVEYQGIICRDCCYTLTGETWAPANPYFDG